MAWIYLAESVECRLPWHHGFESEPIVSAIDTARRSCCPGCETEAYPSPQCGMTCEPLRVKNLLVELVLSRSSTADSPARISALQELEQAWLESEAGYFSRSYDYVAIFDRDSFSWRTSQLSLFGTLTEFSWSSLRWGMTVGGRLYQPESLEPFTLENDGTYLPTPTACDYGKNVGRRSDGVTPSGRDRWSLTVRARRGELPGHPKGALNPEWVEQAMDYPTGWTAIEAWATPFIEVQRKRRSKD